MLLGFFYGVYKWCCFHKGAPINVQMLWLECIGFFVHGDSVEYLLQYWVHLYIVIAAIEVNEEFRYIELHVCISVGTILE